MRHRERGMFGFIVLVLVALGLPPAPPVKAQPWEVVLGESNQLPDGQPYGTVSLNHIYDGGKRGVEITVTADENIFSPGGGFGIQNFSFNTTVINPATNLLIGLPDFWSARFGPVKLSEFGRFDITVAAEDSIPLNPLVIEIYHRTGDLSYSDFTVANRDNRMFSANIADSGYTSSGGTGTYVGTGENPSIACLTTTTTTKKPSTTTTTKKPTTTTTRKPTTTTTTKKPTTTTSQPTSTSSVSSTSTSSVPTTTTTSIPTTTSSVVTTTTTSQPATTTSSILTTSTSSAVTTTTSTIGPCRGEIARGRECPGEEIDDPAYNRPGRRGLAATCNDVIDFTVCSDCVPYDPACLEWTIYPDEPFLSIIQIDDCCWRLLIGESCDQLQEIREFEITVTDPCNGWSDSVILEVGKVTIDVGDTIASPSQAITEVEVSLTNNDHFVRALTTDICECDGGDNLVCSGCTVDPDRSLDFNCSTNELANGCCRVLLFSTNPSALIPQGAGPIATVLYETGEEIPAGGDICLRPLERQVSDQFNEQLCSCQLPGTVSFGPERVVVQIGNGAGIIGTSSNPVDVSLQAPLDEVKAMTLDVCDADNYITGSACGITGRTPPGFDCFFNNLSNGCVRILVFNAQNNDLIPAGEGPVVSLEYDISGEAPVDECRELIPEEVLVVSEDEMGESFPLQVMEEPGSFCFLSAACTADVDCNDELFCNGEETCDLISGICQPGSYPCQTLSCDEENDQCVVRPDAVIVSVGEGSGIPGSTGNPVALNLLNETDSVQAISMNLCDVDNYLTGTGCGPAGRIPAGYECFFNNLSNGCVRIIMVNTGNTDLIPAGDGPVLFIDYDVSLEAPEGECRDIHPEDVVVVAEDEMGDPFALPVLQESGNFCFFDTRCLSDADCNDGVYCNGEETCDLISGDCQPGGGDPCPVPLACDEINERCVSCLVNEECDDGVNCTADLCGPAGDCQNVPDDGFCNDGQFCNGEEICDPVNGCQTGADPCPVDIVCDEVNDMCITQPEENIFIDIIPGSCPNSLNLMADETLLIVALVGTELFDVTTVDPATLLLSRQGLLNGVAPVGWVYKDFATPFEGALCDCHNLNGDGYVDLKLQFDVQALVSELLLGDVIDQAVPLTLSGELVSSAGGIPVLGQDCLDVLEKCKGNFDCDADVDGADAYKFNMDFGRSSFSNPCSDGNICNGDFDCDSDVDGIDAFQFTRHFGRGTLLNPCENSCTAEDYCLYH